MPAFETELEARGRGVIAVVPDDVMEALGGRRVPVVATANGHAWRTTTVVYGGVAMVGLNKLVQAGAGVGAGDRVTLELERDAAPREVEVPRPLADALERDTAARAAFDGLAYTHRREFAEWVADAKKDETRDRRVTKALEMLRAGKTIS